MLLALKMLVQIVKSSPSPGDGGFTMMMGEMLTLKQLNLPVKIFVFNNEELSFIAMEMKASGYLDYATDFVNPDSVNLLKLLVSKVWSIHNSSEVDEKSWKPLTIMACHR